LKSILGYLIIVSILVWIRFNRPEVSHPVMELSVLGIFVFLLGRIFALPGLPVALGFIAGGMICGPHVTGLITQHGPGNFPYFYELCLFWVAFWIGLNFDLSRSKLRSAAVPAVVAGVTFALVSAAAFIMGLPRGTCLAWGIIASSFSPVLAFGTGAQVAMPTWGTAWNVVLFHLTLASIGLGSMLKGELILHLAIPVGVGFLIGKVLDDIIGFTGSVSTSLIVCSGAFLSAVILSRELDLPYPLMAFMAGATVSGFGGNRERFLSFSPPLVWISLAFVLGIFGSEVDLVAVRLSFGTIWPAVLTYIALMVGGKMIGIFLSSSLIGGGDIASLSRSLLPQSVFTVWLMNAFPGGVMDPKLVPALIVGISFSSLILPVLVTLKAGPSGPAGEGIFPGFGSSRSSEGGGL